MRYIRSTEDGIIILSIIAIFALYKIIQFIKDEFFSGLKK